MKKALLPLMIASLVPAAAFADITVYGKANVSFQNTQKAAKVDYTEVVSNASRVGFKGSETINDDLKAIYQFEYQTRVDDGATPFSQRNIYAGLQHSVYGTVMAGNFDTPTKLAQEKIDLFNDLVGDFTEVIEGEIRAKNIIQYSTPVFSNVTVNAAYINSEKDAKYQANGMSGSVVYNTKAFYLAVAADHNVPNASGAALASVDTDLIRIVGRVTFDSVVLGAMWSDYDNGGLYNAPAKVPAGSGIPTAPAMINEDGLLFSAQYNVNADWALKAQIAQSDMKKAGGESLSLGVDRKLSKAAKVYAFYTTIQDDGVTAKLATATTEAVAAVAARDDKIAGVGLELNF